ncbi:ROK family transcriptional regulator [Streptomycetaceae bacterium NBC_01309]
MAVTREQQGLGALLALIASGRAVTRTELAAVCGLSRSTVTQRVNRLLDAGLVTEQGNGASEGGRPPTVLALAPGGGVLLAADLGATHARLAVADLGGDLLAETEEDLSIDDGPGAVLGLVRDGWRRLLAGLDVGPGDVRGVGIGVPGPVEFSTGTVVRPPIMAGWDGFRVPGFFTDYRDVPIVVDNDVNLMVLGEHREGRAAEDNLLYIKIGTGIGCGTVSAGRLYRGSDGAAGDIGHIRLPGHEETVCHCGNTGCVEAVASGAALVRRLRAAGREVRTARDVARLAAEGDTVARRALRVAARQIGEVLAAVVSFHNPGRILIGGSFAAVGDDVVAEIKAVVYRRVLPLATRTLQIETGPLGDRAAVVGAVALAQEHALTPAALATLFR